MTNPVAIPHNGDPYPGSPLDKVIPTYRGPEKAGGVRIPFAAAARLDWSHDGGDDDIVPYVVEAADRQ